MEMMDRNWFETGFNVSWDLTDVSTLVKVESLEKFTNI